ncbi:unnamed protein product, partial [Lepidochelys olivacea]
ICPESIKNRIPEALGDLPWHFLRKVMALNGTARNTSIGHKAPAEEMDDYEEKLHTDGTFCFSDTEMKVSLQSLDVLCAVLLCSVSYSRRSCPKCPCAICPPSAATHPQHPQGHPTTVGHQGHCEEVEAALPGTEQRVQRGEPGAHRNANDFFSVDGELQLLQVPTPQ